MGVCAEDEEEEDETDRRREEEYEEDASAAVAEDDDARDCEGGRKGEEGWEDGGVRERGCEERVK